MLHWFGFNTLGTDLVLYLLILSLYDSCLKLLQMLGHAGKEGFYKGRIAQAIVDIVQQNGGTLTVEDLENHCSTFCDPISTTYRGIRVWEVPPNGQGITVLIALNILEKFDISGKNI